MAKKLVVGADGSQSYVDTTAADDAQAAADALAWQAAQTPQSLTQVDQNVLNASLAAPGSVFRGLALVVLDLAKGVIPVDPNYTTQQLIDAIQQRMR